MKVRGSLPYRATLIATGFRSQAPQEREERTMSSKPMDVGEAYATYDLATRVTRITGHAMLSGRRRLVG